jgi:signal transduction histidine kinase
MRYHFSKAFNTVIHNFVSRDMAKEGTIPNVQKHRELTAAQLTVPKFSVFPLNLPFKPVLFGKRLSAAAALNTRPKTQISMMQCLAALSLLAAFIINILTPPVFVIDILYTCSIVLVFKQNTKTILCFSVAACILVVVNALFFDIAVEHNMSLWTNRLISLLSIGITSYIAVHYRRQTEAGTRKQQQYIAALEAMLFMVSHQVRKPVANILGLVEVIGTNNADLSEADIRALSTHLQTSGIELDTFIKALSTFMEQTGKEHQAVAKHSSFAP